MSLSRTVLIVLSSFLVASCAPAPETHPQASSSDLQGSYLGQTPPAESPEVFAPGVISGPGSEGSLVFSPDGKEAYFHLVEPVEGGGPPTVTLMISRQVEGRWTPPEAVAFSGEHMDGYPAMHPDGSRLFFQSDRPIDPSESSFQYNIWYVDREGEGWSEPRSIGRPVNGRNHTGGASVTMDGTLYFTIMDMGGPQELYRSQFVDGTYAEPERLPSQVNARVQQCDSYVAPDESFLVFFAIEGPGGHGQPSGLFVTFRDEEGEWSEAKNMGPLFNSGEMTGSATISPDGRYVFFSQPDGNGGDDMDVFWADSRIVMEMKEDRPGS